MAKKQKSKQQGEYYPQIALKSDTASPTMAFSSNTSFDPSDTKNTVIIGNSTDSPIRNSSITAWNDHLRGQARGLPPYACICRIKKGKFRIAEVFHDHSSIFVETEVHELVVLRSDDRDHQNNPSDDWTIILGIAPTHATKAFKAEQQWPAEAFIKPYVGLNRRARFMAECTSMGRFVMDKTRAELVILSDGTKKYVPHRKTLVIDQCRFVKIVVGNYRDIDHSRFDLDVLNCIRRAPTSLHPTSSKSLAVSTMTTKVVKKFPGAVPEETKFAKTEEIQQDMEEHESSGFYSSSANLIQPEVVKEEAEDITMVTPGVSFEEKVDQSEDEQDTMSVDLIDFSDEIRIRYDVNTKTEIETEAKVYHNNINRTPTGAEMINKKQCAEIPLSLSRWAPSASDRSPTDIPQHRVSFLDTPQPRVLFLEIPQLRPTDSLLFSRPEVPEFKEFRPLAAISLLYSKWAPL